MRHTRGHTGNRRSHHALKKIVVIKDAETGALRLPHRLDEKTGMYRGRQIMTPKAPKGAKHVHKGPSTEPKGAVAHDHAHDHANAEVKATKPVQGKVSTGGRPKARSGFGGGA